MANASFDVTTGVDLQEVDNAVNQSIKEILTRYDFKGTHCTIELDRKSGTLKLEADDQYRMQAVVQVLREKMSRRQVPLKNLDMGDVEDAGGGRARLTIGLKQGIPTDTGKQIVKDVKDQKLKKVQVQIQGDQLRVTSPSRDALQEVIAFLRSKDYGVELQFGNYR